MSRDDYEDAREDFLAEDRARRHKIASRSCCDGLCGALDCVRCRGAEAEAYIEAEEREGEDEAD